MKKKSPDFIGKALVLSLILIVIYLIGGFAHLQFSSWFKWVSTVVQAIGTIVFCMQFGKQRTDGVTFGKVFGYGFKLSLIVSLVTVLYTLLSNYLIFPEFTDLALQNARANMEAKGGLSEEQIDQGMAITRKFMQPLPLSIIVFLATLFVGTIASLLGGLFTKKSEPVTIFEESPNP
jgi:hypothetical protein